jgi:polyisoprenoid-binding protein YceI
MTRGRGGYPDVPHKETDVTKRVVTAVALVLLVAGVGRAAEVKFALSGDNTKVTFVGTKPEGKHDGGFKTLTGTAAVDPADPTTLTLAVEIDMNSLYSDDPKLTGHLKTTDFFGVKNNPKSKFVSTKVEKDGAGYKVFGKLTLVGKTKEVTFPAKITASAGKLTLKSDFKIDRTAWGMSYGKGKIADEVSIGVAVEAAK